MHIQIIYRIDFNDDRFLLKYFQKRNGGCGFTRKKQAKSANEGNTKF